MGEMKAREQLVDVKGHKLVWDSKTNTYSFPGGIEVDVRSVHCRSCGRQETDDGHDACLADLPGVVNACCGHGTKKGYIMLEGGTTIRGNFEIKKGWHCNKEGGEEDDE